MDVSKEDITKDMLQAAHQRYPDLLTARHVVPIMHFNRTAVHKTVRDFPFSLSLAEGRKSGQVQLQKMTDASTCQGHQTEQLLARCLLRITQTAKDPMFLLLDYNLENYLVHLISKQKRRKTPKEKSEGAETEANTETKKAEEVNVSIGEVGNVNDGAERLENMSVTEGRSIDSNLTETRRSKPDPVSGCTKRKKTVEEDFQVLFAQLEAKVKQINRKSPFPSAFDFEDDNFRRGQYDALIISRDLGLVVVEVKTMKDRGSIAQERTLLSSESTTLTSESTPLTSENTLLSSESTPLTTESIPLTSESTPLTSGSIFFTSEGAPLTCESTLQTSESSPQTSESSPLTSKNTPLTSESTPLTFESIPLTSESICLTSESIPLASQSTHATFPSTCLTFQTLDTERGLSGESRDEDPNRAHSSPRALPGVMNSSTRNEIDERTIVQEPSLLSELHRETPSSTQLTRQRTSPMKRPLTEETVPLKQSETNRERLESDTLKGKQAIQSIQTTRGTNGSRHTDREEERNQSKHNRAQWTLQSKQLNTQSKQMDAEQDVDQGNQERARLTSQSEQLSEETTPQSKQIDAEGETNQANQHGTKHTLQTKQPTEETARPKHTDADKEEEKEEEKTGKSDPDITEKTIPIQWNPLGEETDQPRRPRMEETLQSQQTGTNEEANHSNQPTNEGTTRPTQTLPEGETGLSKPQAKTDSAEEAFLADLQKTVGKAIKQLQQAGLVLGYLTSDLALQSPPVNKVLALPFVSRERLEQVLVRSPSLSLALCQCLNAHGPHEALKKCLCADEAKEDELSLDENSPEAFPKIVTHSQQQQPEMQDRLQAWWTEMTKAMRQDDENLSSRHAQMTNATYEQLVARFCGKFSRVEGHSVADCIHLTGIHFGRSILRQEQLDILDCPHPFALLTGSPGSGKTLLLGLKAVEWARAGGVVLVVCTKGVFVGSLVSRQLCQRIREALGGSGSTNSSSSSSSSQSPSDSGKSVGSHQHDLQMTGEASSTTTAGGHQDLSGQAEDVPQAKKKPGSASSRRRQKARQKKQAERQAAPTLADNVFLETISNDTNIDHFVDDLLQKHAASGRKVLFLMDELQKVITQEMQLGYLAKGIECLEKIRSVYQDLHRLVADVEDDDAQRTEQGEQSLEEITPDRQASGSPGENVEEVVNHVKDLVKTMGTRLGYLSSRLGKLVPRSGGPEVMQREEWRHRQSRSQLLHAEVLQLWNRLQEEDVPLKILRAGRALCMEEKLVAADKDMVVGMGHYYHAHSNLHFFVNDGVLNTLYRLRSSADLAVWASSNHTGYSPQGFVVKRLTQCLRCPPVVQELLGLTLDSVQHAPECHYTRRVSSDTCPFPFPADGPEVKWMDHGPHLSRYKEINDCPLCGQALAQYFLQDLKIGCLDSQEGLALHDVIITGSPIHQSDCRFLEELRTRGINTVYENQELKSPPPYPNKVTIMGGATVQGLETKIVVYVPEIKRVPFTDKDKLSASGSATPSTVPSNGNHVSIPIPAFPVTTVKSDSVTASVNSSPSSTPAVNTSADAPVNTPTADSVVNTTTADAVNNAVSTEGAVNASTTGFDVSTSTTKAVVNSSTAGFGAYTDGASVNTLAADADTHITGSTINSSVTNSLVNNSESHSLSVSNQNPAEISTDANAGVSTGETKNAQDCKTETRRSVEEHGRNSGTSRDPGVKPGKTDAEKLRLLGVWNKEYLFRVASRCVSQLVVFHV